VLREYALLADGERGVLVGPRGDFAWMCFPQWDDEAVFTSLVGGGGRYVVVPSGRFVWGGYYDGGLIWRNRWVTDGGATVESREALALPSGRDRAVVLRRVLVRDGRGEIDVGFALGGTPKHDEDGVWRGRAGDCRFAWHAGDGVEARDGALTTHLTLDAGEHRDLILVLAREADALDIPDADAAWRTTEVEWATRIPSFDATIAPRDARHAYAVMAGLTSDEGAMVAAATTSLPERARGGRNYDYRYAWIRDQCYVGEAVATAGPHPLLDDAVRFVSARLREDGASLKPAYTIRGGPIPSERKLDLPGYPGADVIAGNHVSEQFQLDAFGEALLLFAAADGHDHLESESWSAAVAAAAGIGERWHERDAGIWELDPDEWTHSRLICAAGLRAISACSAAGRHAPDWLALADRITAEVASTALHPSGRWQRSPTDERVDVALLLPALRGAVPPDDPRSVATLTAVVEELTEDGYAYRFRPDERPLGAAEGAFLLCGFVLALAWAQQGEHVKAARWFERNRAACGPPGLLSEEFDVGQRQLRGNLPQAFVHGLLLECAVALAASG
jgi:alpha,alpha-trehalase